MGRRIISEPVYNISPKEYDLKTFCTKACIDIYKDFDESEIGSQPKSIQEAWKDGKKALEELYGG
jgi:hypothetical protein